MSDANWGEKATARKRHVASCAIALVIRPLSFLILLGLLFLPTAHAVEWSYDRQAIEVLPLRDLPGHLISTQAWYVEDPDQTYDVDVVRAIHHAAWTPLAHRNQESGLEGQSFWIKLHVDNLDSDARTVYLEQLSTTLSQFSVWSFDDQTGVAIFQDISLDTPMEQRPVHAPMMTVALELKPLSQNTLYIRLLNQTELPANIGVRAWTSKSFLKHATVYHVQHVVFMTVLVTMAFVAGVYFFYMPRWRFIYYCGWLLFFVFSYGYMTGIARTSFVGQLPHILEPGIYIPGLISLLCLNGFLLRHLNFQGQWARISWVFVAINVYLGVGIIGGVLGLLQPYLSTILSWALLFPVLWAPLSWLAWKVRKHRYLLWNAAGQTLVGFSLILINIIQFTNIPVPPYFESGGPQIPIIFFLGQVVLIALSLTDWVRAQERGLMSGQHRAHTDPRLSVYNYQGFHYHARDFFKTKMVQHPAWIGMIEVDEKIPTEQQLQHVSRAIKARTFDQDLVSFFGRERRFVILFQRDYQAEALDLMEQIQKLALEGMSSTALIAGAEQPAGVAAMKVATSIGLSGSKDWDTPTLSGLMMAATKGVEAAHLGGGSRVVLIEPQSMKIV